MSRVAERFEDMSQRGRIRLIEQTDGDVCVAVIEDPNSEGRGCMACIEFCSPYAGGGKSPRTLEALKVLMQAIADDNADESLRSRRGERGMGVEAL